MRLSFATAFLLCFLPAAAQVKYDHNWFLATKPAPDPAYGLTVVSFNTIPPIATKVDGVDVDLNFVNASWSDSEGVSRFLVNGCKVLNSSFEVMANGDSLNPGIIHDFYCGNGYPVTQGLIVLSTPETETTPYILHLGLDEVPGHPTSPPTKLYCTSVDTEGSNGLGEVLQKNQVIISDTLCKGQFTAVRHADGSRWWAVIPENATNGYYIVLLDGDGPQVHRKQLIGTVQHIKDWGGQAVFSPDGRFYARADGYSGLEVMEFDRCHGALFNPRHVELPFEEGALLGAAISPNSRYLYVSSQVVLLQYDLLAPNLAASVDTVGVYDGFESWLPATFYMMQLGPDGKIYMTTSNGTNVLHVVQQPDGPGAACQFEQHAVTLPTYYGFSPPNFPNYRLGPAPENYCDSVTATVDLLPLEEDAMKVYPNPASDYITIEFNNPTDGELRIVDMQGRLTYRADVPESSNDIFLDTSLWPNGIYLCQYWANGKVVAMRKSILAH